MVYDDVLLRFDQLKQCVVVLPPGEKVFCVPDQAHIDWFEMDGRRYVHDPEDGSRYASLLCEGKTNGIRLYHSEWKDLNGYKIIAGDRRAVMTLRTEEHFTLMTPDGGMHQVKRASDITKFFPEQKKQIRQYVKKNHLSFSKSEREGSLVKVVQSLSGTPIIKEERGERKEERENPSGARLPVAFPLSSDSLITGIPVLDSDTVSIAAGSAKTKVYVVPGVKKAKASISDDQELAEIVVVAGC